MTRFLIFILDLYRRFVSPLKPPICRYRPTCSGYAVAALQIHGPFKGTVLALWRVLRCAPWGGWGPDPVPPKGHWRNDPALLERLRNGGDSEGSTDAGVATDVDAGATHVCPHCGGLTHAPVSDDSTTGDQGTRPSAVND